MHFCFVGVQVRRKTVRRFNYLFKKARIFLKKIKTIERWKSLYIKSAIHISLSFIDGCYHKIFCYIFHRFVDFDR